MLCHCSRSRWNFTNCIKLNTIDGEFFKIINTRSDGFAVALADFKYRFEKTHDHVLDSGHRFNKVSCVEKVNISVIQNPLNRQQ